MLFAKKTRRITRVLVLEDEPLVAFDAEHLLGDEGFEIVATLDRVADALALIADGVDIDLVLADLTLADGSGIDVARAASERGVPVLFVTGDCPGDAKALAHGCLSKPYAARDLIGAIAAVEKLLDGGRPRRLPANFSLFATPV
jgi:CheY-like chemotaxis protein